MSAHTSAQQIRPREKMARYGPGTLSLQELWMCILGSGTTQTPVTLLSERITARLRDGSFYRLRGEEIGLGPAQSARLQAIQELVIRLNQRSQVRLQSVRDVTMLCQDFAQSQRERLRIFYCSTDAKVLLQEDIAIGGINMVSVSPKEVFFPIRWHPVDSLVICHNHPSGNVEPSAQDKVFTTRIEAAAQLLGIWLRDHVIVGGGKTYSFREEGLLL